MSIDVRASNISNCSIPDDAEHSRYRFVIVAGRRARQLQAGALPFLATSGKKATVMAMEETRRGLVKYVLTHPDMQPIVLEPVEAE